MTTSNVIAILPLLALSIAAVWKVRGYRNRRGEIGDSSWGNDGTSAAHHHHGSDGHSDSGGH